MGFKILICERIGTRLLYLWFKRYKYNFLKPTKPLQNLQKPFLLKWPSQHKRMTKLTENSLTQEIGLCNEFNSYTDSL